MKINRFGLSFGLIILGLVVVSCDQPTRLVDRDNLIDFVYVKGEDIPYTGTAKRYHENGELREVIHYVNGRLNGPYIEYDEYGERYQEGQFINGSREGTWYMEDRDNGIYTKALFKDDQYHGEIILEYDDGSKQIGLFIKGNMHGRYQAFYPNGMPQEESVYINGELHGQVTKWDEKGNEIYSREYERVMPK